MAESDENIESDGFSVLKVVDTKIKNGCRFYKVRWQDSWEPEENLNGCKELIDRYWENVHNGLRKDVLRNQRCEFKFQKQIRKQRTNNVQREASTRRFRERKRQTQVETSDSDVRKAPKKQRFRCRSIISDTDGDKTQSEADLTQHDDDETQSAGRRYNMRQRLSKTGNLGNSIQIKREQSVENDDESATLFKRASKLKASFLIKKMSEQTHIGRVSDEAAIDSDGESDSNISISSTENTSVDSSKPSRRACLPVYMEKTPENVTSEDLTSSKVEKTTSRTRIQPSVSSTCPAQDSSYFFSAVSPTYAITEINNRNASIEQCSSSSTTTTSTTISTTITCVSSAPPYVTITETDIRNNALPYVTLSQTTTTTMTGIQPDVPNRITMLTGQTGIQTSTPPYCITKETMMAVQTSTPPYVPTTAAATSRTTVQAGSLRHDSGAFLPQLLANQNLQPSEGFDFNKFPWRFISGPSLSKPLLLQHLTPELRERLLLDVLFLFFIMSQKKSFAFNNLQDVHALFVAAIDGRIKKLYEPCPVSQSILNSQFIALYMLFVDALAASLPSACLPQVQNQCFDEFKVHWGRLLTNRALGRHLVMYRQKQIENRLGFYRQSNYVESLDGPTFNNVIPTTLIHYQTRQEMLSHPRHPLNAFNRDHVAPVDKRFLNNLPLVRHVNVFPQTRPIPNTSRTGVAHEDQPIASQPCIITSVRSLDPSGSSTLSVFPTNIATAVENNFVTLGNVVKLAKPNQQDKANQLNGNTKGKSHSNTSSEARLTDDVSPTSVCSAFNTTVSLVNKGNCYLQPICVDNVAENKRKDIDCAPHLVTMTTTFANPAVSNVVVTNCTSNGRPRSGQPLESVVADHLTSLQPKPVSTDLKIVPDQDVPGGIQSYVAKHSEAIMHFIPDKKDVVGSKLSVHKNGLIEIKLERGEVIQIRHKDIVNVKHKLKNKKNAFNNDMTSVSSNNNASMSFSGVTSAPSNGVTPPVSVTSVSANDMASI